MLLWYSSVLTTVDFNSLREIRIGQNTLGFEINGKRQEYEGRAFSIISFDGVKMKMLNLVAPTITAFKVWINGLDMLASQYCLLHNLPGIGKRIDTREDVRDIDYQENEDLERRSTTLPSPSASEFAGVSLSDNWKEYLVTGSRMLKISSKANMRIEARFVKVELDPLNMVWESKKQTLRTCRTC